MTTDPTTALTTLDDTFDGDADDEVIKPIFQEHPYLQSFNGLSTTTMETALGPHIQAEVNPHLDEVATELGLKRYIVQHKTVDANGSAKQLPYWALSWGQKPVSLFVISRGLQSKHQMRTTDERLGIAYGWETLRDKEGKIIFKPNSTEPKGHYRLQFRAYEQGLYAAGFHEWLQVSMSGYITDYMLNALNEHFRTLEAYRAYMEHEKGKQRNAPFFGFSLPLLPGPLKMVGPETGKSPIYPPIAQIPPQINRQFLLDHAIPSELLARIREELDDTVAWSIERSMEFKEGKAPSEESGWNNAVTAEVEDVTAVPEDRLVNTEELRWVVNGFCTGNQSVVKMVCQRFGVATPAELRAEHYATLYHEATNPEPAH